MLFDLLSCLCDVYNVLFKCCFVVCVCVRHSVCVCVCVCVRARARALFVFVFILFCFDRCSSGTDLDCNLMERTEGTPGRKILRTDEI